MFGSISNLIITGGTGYIGKALISRCNELGIKIILLGRLKDHFLHADICFYHWSVGDPLPYSIFQDLGIEANSCAVIHLAHSWQITSLGTKFEDENINLLGAKILIDSCKYYGVKRFVFASSLSSRADSVNAYGRVKNKIEKIVVDAGGISARIGLVYGGSKAGMYGTIVKLTGLPVLPMLTPQNLVQPIHLFDVCDCLLKLVHHDGSRVVILANHEPMPFGKFLKIVSRIEHGKKLTIIPIPLWLALFGAFLTRIMPGLPNIDRERVLGLVGARMAPAMGAMEGLGIRLGAYDNLSATSKGVRGLLIEGIALLTYALEARPSQSLLRRYVRALKQQRDPDASCSPMGLPFWAIICPRLLFLLEATSNNTLMLRLEFASQLAEFSSVGGLKFFKKNKNLLYFVSLIFRVLIEIIITPLKRLANIGVDN